MGEGDRCPEGSYCPEGSPAAVKCPAGLLEVVLLISIYNLMLTSYYLHLTLSFSYSDPVLNKVSDMVDSYLKILCTTVTKKVNYLFFVTRDINFYKFRDINVSKFENISLQ